MPVSEKQKKRKSAYRRKTKQERESLQFWAEGARQDILEPELPAYATALADSNREIEHAELQRIANKFFYYIPFYLEDHEEPEPRAEEYDPSKHIDTDEGLSTAEIKEKRAKINHTTEVSAREMDKA
jgi:hypothetical protein